MRFKFGLVCVLGVLGCEPDETTPIVDVSSWVEVASEDDPFPARPENPECPPSSRVVEIQNGIPFLEIDTGLCDYITLRQATLVDLREGDTVRFEWGHRDLNAGDLETATGHMAFRLGDTVLEDVTVDIPQEAKQYVVTFEMKEALDAGSWAWLNLYNHGDNQWYFAAAEVVPN